MARVSEALTDHLQDFITFPPILGPVKRASFQEIRGFPLVVGCIDGTHIPLICPYLENGEVFRNHKGPINVQVIISVYFVKTQIHLSVFLLKIFE